MARLTREQADRWHDLLDLRAKRPLSFTEEVEYLELVEIVKRLDMEAQRCLDDPS